MKFIFTKEKEWLAKWDEYVNKHSKGSHLVYSDWLKSYQSYGFDFEIALIIDDNTIVGGCGVVIPKFLFFKFYIIPHGPIYNKAYESYFKQHIIEIKKHAIQFGFCYMQLSFPISSNKKVNNYAYNTLSAKTLNELEIKSGKLFKYVYSSYGLNWIDLRDYKNVDDFLAKLTPKVRRNIRIPYNKLATVQFLTKTQEIEKAYDVIVENATQGGYSVRSFNEFKNTINQLISKERAYFIVCKVEGQIKAAAFFVETSGYITNIMGGVSRVKPDIKLGYMLQWEIIKKSFELGYSGYNISMGGSLGVQEFKSKFGAESIFYQNPHYYYILKPFYFKLFKLFDTKLKPYKRRVSLMLSRIKKST